MKEVLLSHNIVIGSHRARKIKISDYNDFDFIKSFWFLNILVMLIGLFNVSSI